MADVDRLATEEGLRKPVRDKRHQFGRVERREKAEANLAWMRNLPVTHEYMQEELVMINEQIERELSDRLF